MGRACQEVASNVRRVRFAEIASRSERATSVSIIPVGKLKAISPSSGRTSQLGIPESTRESKDWGRAGAGRGFSGRREGAGELELWCLHVSFRDRVLL